MHVCTSVRMSMRNLSISDTAEPLESRLQYSWAYGPLGTERWHYYRHPAPVRYTTGHQAVDVPRYLFLGGSKAVLWGAWVTYSGAGTAVLSGRLFW